MNISEMKKYSPFFKEYTELRVQENSNTYISLLKGDINNNHRSSMGGVSARVFKNGLWGFSSNPIVSDQTIKEMIKAATDNALFLSNKTKVIDDIILPNNPVNSINDFTTKKNSKSQKELIEFLKEIDNYICKKFPDLSSRNIILSNLNMKKSLITSDGSSSFSMIPRSLLYIILNIEKNKEPFELFGSYGGFGQFEDVFDNPESLYEEITEQYEHVRKKSEAIYANAGIKECILDADLAGILAHEAIGHTTEADGVLGGSIAGSYLNQQVASPLISLVDFANTAFGKICPVPVFVDDEGTKAEDAVIIENGILKGYMHNKDSARRFNVSPTGNARAYEFSDEPLIRMRNTTIIPGESKLDDMISSIDDGYYLMKASNGQADSTSEFMFGVTLGYEIKNGKIGKAIKDTTISGVAFDMLKTVEMVSDDLSWDCSGMCGKKQWIPAAMGGPAIKCKINIGGK